MKRAFSVTTLVLGISFVSVVFATAQEKSVKPGINKLLENPHLKDYLKKFERESREIAAKVKEIVAPCNLKPGMVIADVGAGMGLFTRKFAAEVGEKGKIYAVDISPTFLRPIKKTCADRFEKKEAKEHKLDLHIVPTPIKSYRLLSMSMDDDGFIWTGSIHRVVHRYDPRTGKVESIPLPFQATANACMCVGKKVYILGQTYPKLIIYDRTAKNFNEAAYPSAKPNVWYGTEAHDDRHIFLFDRGGAGVIKWDTHRDQGKAIPWPYKVPFPGGGTYETDKAIWCGVWELTGSYQPFGLARLDIEKNEFTGYFPFPKNDAGLKPYTDPATTLFLPYSLKGKIVPFDFKAKRWCQFLDVPQYGKLFGFMGGPIPHKGRYYFSLSTYNGTATGCDGKPYHFCNAILEFDPQTRRFEFLTLAVKNAYYQIAYMLSAKGEFFATGSNIREKDGTLNRDRSGEVVFWQTRKPEKQ